MAQTTSRRDGDVVSLLPESPGDRLKRLTNVGVTVTVDPNVPIQR